MIRSPSPSPRGILTVSCPARRGIVAAISGTLLAEGCNIVEAQQFDDTFGDRFFMRVVFDSEDGATLSAIAAAFRPVADRHDMVWEIHDATARTRALIMVSRLGHCLNDLLYRVSIGSLPIDVPVVVSNHDDLEPLVRAAGVRFVHLPVTPSGKARAEAQLAALHDELDCEMIVLARYMQVLSDDFCSRHVGRIINIHHSVLPSFKGARPYHQAHARGVKLVGATAHYVTADLDEGPIIEQRVARVTHAMGPAALAESGRDVEALTLSAAVRWHAERRVLLNGDRTIVFS